MAPDGPEDELSAGNGLGEALGMPAAGGAPGPEAVDSGGASPTFRLLQEEGCGRDSTRGRWGTGRVRGPGSQLTVDNAGERWCMMMWTVAIRVTPSFGHPARLVVQPSRVTPAQDKKFPVPVLFMSFYTVSQHTVSQPGSGVSAVFPGRGVPGPAGPGSACAGLCAGAGPGRGAIGHDHDGPGPLAQLPAARDSYLGVAVPVPSPHHLCAAEGAGVLLQVQVGRTGPAGLAAVRPAGVEACLVVQLGDHVVGHAGLANPGLARHCGRRRLAGGPAGLSYLRGSVSFVP